MIKLKFLKIMELIFGFLIIQNNLFKTMLKKSKKFLALRVKIPDIKTKREIKNKLMIHCDELKRNVSKVRKYGEELMEDLLRESLEGA